MSIVLTHDKQQNILTAKITGYTSLCDFQQVIHQIMTSKDIPSDVNTLWDISEMNFDAIDFEFEQALVDMRKEFNKERGAAKIAIYSDYKLGEPLVKLFIILSKDISQAIKSFTSIEETHQWLTE